MLFNSNFNQLPTWGD